MSSGGGCWRGERCLSWLDNPSKARGWDCNHEDHSTKIHAHQVHTGQGSLHMLQVGRAKSTGQSRRRDKCCTVMYVLIVVLETQVNLVSVYAITCAAPLSPSKAAWTSVYRSGVQQGLVSGDQDQAPEDESDIYTWAIKAFTHRV